MRSACASSRSPQVLPRLDPLVDRRQRRAGVAVVGIDREDIAVRLDRLTSAPDLALEHAERREDLPPPRRRDSARESGAENGDALLGIPLLLVQMIDASEQIARGRIEGQSTTVDLDGRGQLTAHRQLVARLHRQTKSIGRIDGGSVESARQQGPAPLRIGQLADVEERLECVVRRHPRRHPAR